MRKCRAFPSGYAKIMPNDIVATHRKQEAMQTGPKNPCLKIISEFSQPVKI
ncbi:Uncharacterized protein dnm_043610 [Desulfonema magnum]|uniref:Uncharacterized protein n=1 Tax=Desulfonema magnum TaxID=45655 RepID=A0A975GPW2_9BACT|nr:Uncharacterized protein dnm_043610 [Desulfonema magnum]